jgi:hypothetical protein
MMIMELLECMLGQLMFPGGHKLCAVDDKNLGRRSIPCKSHFEYKNSVMSGERIRRPRDT